MEQLAFEGLKDPLTPLEKTDYFIKGHFIEAVREEMSNPSVFNFTMSYGIGDYEPYPVQLRLFEPAPRCDQYLELDDQSIECHLDRGHKGLHFDAQYHVDWSCGG